MNRFAAVCLLGVIGMMGCGKPEPKSAPLAPPTIQPSTETGVTPTIRHILSPFGKRHHGHPTVSSWYSELHGRHTFNCLDSPEHSDYSCKSCPVGPPDRVVEFPHGDYRDVPITINAYFACGAINTLIPEPSSFHDSDEFYCEREPADGYIVLGGHKISCAGSDQGGTTTNLGTIQPGETKTLTLPVPDKEFQ